MNKKKLVDLAEEVLGSIDTHIDKKLMPNSEPIDYFIQMSIL